MDYTNSPACLSRLHDLKNEYAFACDMIHRGHRISLNNQLRQSLNNIAEEVRGALNDHAALTIDDVKMLCVDETKATLKGRQSYANHDKNNYAHTLFYLTRLWLSEGHICD